MKRTDTYNPKFDTFHGRHMVTWSENGVVRIAENLLLQYRSWKINKEPKHEPHPAFWQSLGPAIVRALTFFDAKGLVMDRVTDRRVSYVWFASKDDVIASRDRYVLCSVVAEGGSAGLDTCVVVTLPTEEVATFSFSASGMVDWLRPEPPPDSDARDRVISSEIQDLITTKAAR